MIRIQNHVFKITGQDCTEIFVDTMTATQVLSFKINKDFNATFTEDGYVIPNNRVKQIVSQKYRTITITTEPSQQLVQLIQQNIDPNILQEYAQPLHEIHLVVNFPEKGQTQKPQYKNANKTIVTMPLLKHDNSLPKNMIRPRQMPQSQAFNLIQQPDKTLESIASGDPSKIVVNRQQDTPSKGFVALFNNERQKLVFRFRPNRFETSGGVTRHLGPRHIECRISRVLDGALVGGIVRRTISRGAWDSSAHILDGLSYDEYGRSSDGWFSVWRRSYDVSPSVGNSSDYSIETEYEVEYDLSVGMMEQLVETSTEEGFSVLFRYGLEEDEHGHVVWNGWFPSFVFCLNSVPSRPVGLEMVRR